MLIEYANYVLKEGYKYPFANNEYSEIVYYTEDDSIFKIVNESFIIKKTIDQMLMAGYFDQYNKKAVKNIFENKLCYFLFDDFQNKYSMKVYFDENEKNLFSSEFQNILIAKQCVVFKMILSDLEYISIESMEHKDKIKDGDYIETFWMYNLTFDKEQLDNIK